MKKFSLLTRRFWKKKLGRNQVSKRQQFVIVTTVLTALLIITQLSRTELRYDLIVGLAIATYIGCSIALREDLKGIEFFTLLVLPTLFTTAVSLFYFLLPARLIIRLPIAIGYFIGIYALLLTENIYNVAVERSIQLLRAGQGVGLLISIITMFFLTDAAISLHLGPFGKSGFIVLIVTPLALQALWSMELSVRFSPAVMRTTGVIVFLLAQAAFVFAFWPIQATIEALFLTTAFYTLVGMGQQHLVGRLFSKTKIEFITVLVAIFAVVVFVTQWGSGQ